MFNDECCTQFYCTAEPQRNGRERSDRRQGRAKADGRSVGGRRAEAGGVLPLAGEPAERRVLGVPDGQPAECAGEHDPQLPKDRKPDEGRDRGGQGDQAE